MSPTEISQLLPLGGASVLLIYLLRLLMAERARWSAERKAMIEEHKQDLEQQGADLLRMIERLRGRVVDLEAQVDRLRENERINRRLTGEP